MLYLLKQNFRFFVIAITLYVCEIQLLNAQSWPTISLSSPISGLNQPVHITHAGDGSGRVFIVERAGLIRIIKNGVVQGTPFLDLTSKLACPGQSGGLHGMAFPPNYLSKGYFYVKYVDQSCFNVVARFHISGNPDLANLNSEQIVLRVDQLGANPGHIGGPLYFSPQDGYLYITTGDAGNGGAGDTQNNSQNPAQLLGKVLRIDTETGNPATYTIPASNPYINTPGYHGEIWALGVRNPWRFSFDRQTADLYIGDVGEDAREEIHFQPATSPGGENYGWRIMEGSQCYKGGNCDPTGLTLPVAEYDTDAVNCSVTGGMVYRGSNDPNLQGIYFYGDYCSGRIWGLRRVGQTWQTAQFMDTTFNIVSFGEDEAGNVFVTDFTGGVIYKITEVPQAISSLTFVPNPVLAGNNSTGTVSLAVPARPGGEIASLSSDTPQVQVPSSVFFPQDSTSQNFTATTSSVSSSVNVTITAVLNSTVQATLTVNPPNLPPTANLVTPLNNAFYLDPANISLQATATDSDGTVTKVEFYSGPTLISTDTTNPYQANYNSVTQGNYTLTAKSYDNIGGSKTSAPIHVTVYPASFAIPSPWLQADIGGPAGPGNAIYSSNSFTVSGAGSDIWDSADSFHYVYRLLSGDIEIVARVTSLQNTNAWAKAGVMIRENITNNSRYAAMLVTPANGLTFQRRLTSGGTSSSTKTAAGLTAPYWVKLGRTGSTFTASVSANGTGWTVVGTASISMSTNAYVGLAVTSHNNAVLCSAVMDNVSVIGNPPGNTPPSVTITSPAGGAIFTAPANINFTANASDTDGTISQVEFFSGSTSLGVDPSSPYSVPYNNVPAGTYNLTAKATDNVGGFTISNPVTVNVQPPGGGSLPSPWLNQDVGAVGVAGSTSYSSGAFTINGAGSDIWNNVDSFHYVYQPLSGNGDIVARVASQQNTNSWAKAGVMIRDTLAPSSKHASLFVTPTQGLSFQRRLTSSGTSTSTAGGPGITPYWVKISRTGTSFTASRSTNGTNWTVVGSATITMGTNIYIGLAVTSHNNAVLSAAVFDNVSVLPAAGSGLPPPWVNQNVGAVGIPGNASYSSGAFTINAAGDDIWNRADAFHFAYKPLTGDGQIVARAATQQNTNTWAKTGVMIRQTLNADSPHAIMLITPANGLRLQYRTTPGGVSFDISGGTGTVPYWVKLVRSGNTFTGYKSINGTSWTPVGSATISMPASVFIGLAHTSHNNAVLGSAVLDNVTTIP